MFMNWGKLGELTGSAAVLWVCVCVRAYLRVLVCVVLIAGSRIQPSVKPQLQTALNHRLQH